MRHPDGGRLPHHEVERRQGAGDTGGQAQGHIRGFDASAPGPISGSTILAMAEHLPGRRRA